jgi:ATP-dependent Clp protease ATP-binding subunit ClpA
MSQLNLTLDVTEDAVAYLAESGFDKNYGARPVRRRIQTQIEDELAEKILQGEIVPGDSVQIDYREEKMVFSKL